MRTRIVFSIAAAVVVMIVFGSMRATGAMWSDQQDVSGGTLTAGELDLTVASSGTQQDDVSFGDFAKTAMIVNDSVQASLLVRNAGNIPMRVRMQSASVSNSSVSLDLRVSMGASRAECSGTGPAVGSAIYDGPFGGAQAPGANGWRQLPVGGTEVWCFRGTLTAMPAIPTTFTTQLSFRAESL